jgi:hypothetical protein
MTVTNPIKQIVTTALNIFLSPIKMAGPPGIEPGTRD